MTDTDLLPHKQPLKPEDLIWLEKFITDQCNQVREWRMCVPPQDDDSDMVLARILNHLKASTPSSTRANERGDLSDFIKHKQQVIERQMEKHTPHPSPQSDMVAVPREVITDLQGTLNYIAVQGKANHPGFAQVARMNAEDAVKRLQPYTKGE